MDERSRREGPGAQERDGTASAEATRLLGELGSDPSAAERLLPIVYEELRALARRYFRGRERAHTLEATAVVHEAFLRLVGRPDVAWRDRAHFFAVSARAMRMVLADHARARRAEKRGGDRHRVTLGVDVAGEEPRSLDLIALDGALERLAELDERHARIVELRFFSGLTVEDVAEVLDCSRSTVESEWRAIRAWLARELRDPA